LIYAPVVLLSSFGPHVLDLSSLPALAASFSISNASYGSFAAASAVIVQRTANFLDVFLLGTFTPGPGIPGAVASPTSLRISVNQSGESLSEAITLNSPPATIPEPATLALFGGRPRSGGVHGSPKAERLVSPSSPLSAAATVPGRRRLRSHAAQHVARLRPGRRIVERWASIGVRLDFAGSRHLSRGSTRL
jgi:hypothetical protein